MPEYFDNNSVKLNVQNFGPIEGAEIDLRPLTVFIGPSNTGKSYLATLVYALHCCFGMSKRQPKFNSFPGGYYIRPEVRNLASKNNGKSAVETLINSARQFPTEANIETDFELVLPHKVIEDIRTTINPMVANFFNTELRRCFGLNDSNKLIRKQTNFGLVRISNRDSSDLNSIQYEHELHLPNGKPVISMDLPNRISIPFHDWDWLTRPINRISSLKDNQTVESHYYQQFYQILISELIEISIDKSVGSLVSPAHYLPADRTGVINAHKLVVSALIQNASMAGINHSQSAPLLSGVLADFLEKLIKIEPYRRNQLKSEELSSDIEKGILGGEVEIRRELNYPSFVFRPSGWEDELALLNSSSMISELAPIVLYLRYIVIKGDLLIIEEPESHLHPAMQVELMSQLAKVVKAGIRVIITTHSEWLLEKLANIVNSNKIPEPAHSKTTDDSDYCLDSKMVGAWLFSQRKRPKGSIVTEIKLDESGLYPSGFNEVAFELHNEYASIAEKIEGAR